jgi:tetratricopeptide (TPR) repeat protein
MSKRLLDGALALGLAVGFCLLLTATASAQPATEPPVGASVPSVDDIPEVKDAVARFRERDFDGALKKLEDAVKANADLPPAQIMMAQLFAQANIPGGVRNALERAVLASKNDPEAYVILGDFALREGRVTEADLLYGKARTHLEAFNASKKRKEILQPRVIGGLAAVAEARTDWAEAQKLLSEWLKLEPRNAGVMERLARAMFQQKDAAGCLEMLKKAKEADNNMLTPEARLAQFYEAHPDHDNAKLWMDKALQKSPNDLRTLLVAGEWALQTGQIDKAKQYSSEALKAGPQSLEAKVLRGVVALFQGDVKDAEMWFENAALQSPGTFAATNNLALALAEQTDESKKRRALEYAERNVRLFNRVAEAWSTYGWVLYKLGQLDEAEQALKQAASAGQLSADTAYFIAVVSTERGQREQAKSLLKMALDTKRPFSKQQDALMLYERLGGRYDPNEKAPPKDAPKDAPKTAPPAATP